MAKTAAVGKSGENEPAPVVAAAPAKKSKKTLIVVAVAVLLLVAIGVGALLIVKKNAAAAAQDEEQEFAEDEEQTSTPKVDLTQPPVFVPLEPFVVNLADKDADRYAQIAITLQVENAKFAEQLKAFMPAVRNGILMVLAHKTSQELLDRAGKEMLAAEIMRESVRPMGIYIDLPTKEPEHSADAASEDEEPPKRKKASKAKQAVNPVQHVHFSNFIIQ